MSDNETTETEQVTGNNQQTQLQVAPVKMHFLAATEVVFEQQGTRRFERFNVIYPSDSGVLTAADLGRIQQSAQMRFFNTHPSLAGRVNVQDVFFIGVSQLGWMTVEDFNNLSSLELPAAEAQPEAPAKPTDNDNVVEFADPFK